MKIGKISIALCCFITMFLSYSIHTKAVYDIVSSTATYDSNNGLLIIEDPKFLLIDYQNRFVSHAEKMKLGNVVLTGTAEFSGGTMRMYVLNKDAVNQQTQFTIEQTVGNGMDLQLGAIEHIHKPPNGINVQFNNPSNPRSLHVNVIGLRPVMKIQNFYPNVATVEGESNITLTVSGENLDISTFAVYAHHTGKTHTMNVTSTSANVTVYTPANTSEEKRTDTYTLYINGQNSMRDVTVNVAAKKAPPVKPQVPTDEETENDKETPDDAPTNDNLPDVPKDDSDKGSNNSSKPSSPTNDKLPDVGKDDGNKGNSNSSKPSLPSNDNTSEIGVKGIAQVFNKVVKESVEKKVEPIEVEKKSDENISPIVEAPEKEEVVDKMAINPLSNEEEKGNSWLVFVIAIPLLSCFGYFGWKVYKKN